MLISKDNGGKTIGWRETYFSNDESVDVSVHRNVSTITTVEMPVLSGARGGSPQGGVLRQRPLSGEHKAVPQMAATQDHRRQAALPDGRVRGVR
jgi:hypothetical protein